MPFRIEYSEYTRKFEVIRTDVTSYETFIEAISSINSFEGMDFKNLDPSFNEDFKVIKSLFPNKLDCDLTKEAYKIAAKTLLDQLATKRKFDKWFYDLATSRYERDELEDDWNDNEFVEVEDEL